MQHISHSSLIETLEITFGETQRIDLHISRMQRSGESLGFRSPDMDEVVRQIKLSLSDYNLKEHPSVKCTITYHTTVENVKLTPYTARTIKSLKIFDCTDNLDYRYKWADRNCFLPYSTLCHNDQEPLFFKNGLLTDTTYTNIVVEIKGRGLLTPAAPLLQGTRRQLYINQGIIKPADLSIDDCLSAENIHLINSMLPLGTVVLSPLSIS